MKILKNCIKTAIFNILFLFGPSFLHCSEQDTFGENVAKAVLLKWSPKPEHIKTAANAQNENKNTEYVSEESNNDDQD